MEVKMEVQQVNYDPLPEASLKTHLDVILNEVIQLFPEHVQETLREEFYIAGGAIVSYLQNEPISDYDIFVRSLTGVLVVNRYSHTLQGLKTSTENAVTVELKGPKAPAQIITRFHGEPKRIFESFDYEHCKAYYVSSTRELVYNKDLIVNKKLRYTGEDSYPVNALSRMAKYISRGYKIDKESVLNLAMKLSKTNLDDPKVYSDQLIGFYGSSLE